jgi:hypothetical protein
MGGILPQWWKTWIKQKITLWKDWTLQKVESLLYLDRLDEMRNCTLINKTL